MISSPTEPIRRTSVESILGARWNSLSRTELLSPAAPVLAAGTRGTGRYPGDRILCVSSTWCEPSDSDDVLSSLAGAPNVVDQAASMPGSTAPIRSSSSLEGDALKPLLLSPTISVQSSIELEDYYRTAIVRDGVGKDCDAIFDEHPSIKALYCRPPSLPTRASSSVGMRPRPSYVPSMAVVDDYFGVAHSGPTILAPTISSVLPSIFREACQDAVAFYEKKAHRSRMNEVDDVADGIVKFASTYLFPVLEQHEQQCYILHSAMFQFQSARRDSDAALWRQRRAADDKKKKKAEAANRRRGFGDDEVLLLQGSASPPILPALTVPQLLERHAVRVAQLTHESAALKQMKDCLPRYLCHSSDGFEGSLPAATALYNAYSICATRPQSWALLVTSNATEVDGKHELASSLDPILKPIASKASTDTSAEGQTSALSHGLVRLLEGSNAALPLSQRLPPPGSLPSGDFANRVPPTTPSRTTSIAAGASAYSDGCGLSLELYYEKGIPEPSLPLKLDGGTSTMPTLASLSGFRLHPVVAQKVHRVLTLLCGRLYRDVEKLCMLHGAVLEHANGVDDTVVGTAEALVSVLASAHSSAHDFALTSVDIAKWASAAFAMLSSISSAQSAPAVAVTPTAAGETIPREMLARQLQQILHQLFAVHRHTSSPAALLPICADSAFTTQKMRVVRWLLTWEKKQRAEATTGDAMTRPPAAGSTAKPSTSSSSTKAPATTATSALARMFSKAPVGKSAAPASTTVVEDLESLGDDSSDSSLVVEMSAPTHTKSPPQQGKTFGTRGKSTDVTGSRKATAPPKASAVDGGLPQPSTPKKACPTQVEGQHTLMSQLLATPAGRDRRDSALSLSEDPMRRQDILTGLMQQLADHFATTRANRGDGGSCASSMSFSSGDGDDDESSSSAGSDGFEDNEGVDGGGGADPPLCDDLDDILARMEAEGRRKSMRIALMEQDEQRQRNLQQQQRQSQKGYFAQSQGGQDGTMMAGARYGGTGGSTSNMALVVGHIGCGKSAAVAAALQHLNIFGASGLKGLQGSHPKATSSTLASPPSYGNRRSALVLDSAEIDAGSTKRTAKTIERLFTDLTQSQRVVAGGGGRGASEIASGSTVAARAVPCTSDTVTILGKPLAAAQQCALHTWVNTEPVDAEAGASVLAFLLAPFLNSDNASLPLDLKYNAKSANTPPAPPSPNSVLSSVRVCAFLAQHRQSALCSRQEKTALDVWASQTDLGEEWMQHVVADASSTKTYLQAVSARLDRLTGSNTNTHSSLSHKLLLEAGEEHRLHLAELELAKAAEDAIKSKGKLTSFFKPKPEAIPCDSSKGATVVVKRGGRRGGKRSRVVESVSSGEDDEDGGSVEELVLVGKASVNIEGEGGSSSSSISTTELTKSPTLAREGPDVSTSKAPPASKGASKKSMPSGKQSSITSFFAAKPPPPPPASKIVEDIAQAAAAAPAVASSVTNPPPSKRGPRTITSFFAPKTKAPIAPDAGQIGSHQTLKTEEENAASHEFVSSTVAVVPSGECGVMHTTETSQHSESEVPDEAHGVEVKLEDKAVTAVSPRSVTLPEVEEASGCFPDHPDTSTPMEENQSPESMPICYTHSLRASEKMDSLLSVFCAPSVQWGEYLRHNPHTVAASSGSPLSTGVPQRVTLVQVESGDVTLADEPGFHGSLKRMAKESKFPVIVTGNVCIRQQHIQPTVPQPALNADLALPVVPELHPGFVAALLAPVAPHLVAAADAAAGTAVEGELVHSPTSSGKGSNGSAFSASAPVVKGQRSLMSWTAPGSASNDRDRTTAHPTQPLNTQPVSSGQAATPTTAISRMNLELLATDPCTYWLNGDVNHQTWMPVGGEGAVHRLTSVAAHTHALYAAQHWIESLLFNTLRCDERSFAFRTLAEAVQRGDIASLAAAVPRDGRRGQKPILEMAKEVLQKKWAPVLPSITVGVPFAYQGFAARHAPLITVKQFSHQLSAPAVCMSGTSPLTGAMQLLSVAAAEMGIVWFVPCAPRTHGGSPIHYHDKIRAVVADPSKFASLARAVLSNIANRGVTSLDMRQLMAQLEWELIAARPHTKATHTAIVRERKLLTHRSVYVLSQSARVLAQKSVVACDCSSSPSLVERRSRCWWRSALHAELTGGGSLAPTHPTAMSTDYAIQCSYVGLHAALNALSTDTSVRRFATYCALVEELNKAVYMKAHAALLAPLVKLALTPEPVVECIEEVRDVSAKVGSSGRGQRSTKRPRGDGESLRDAQEALLALKEVVRSDVENLQEWCTSADLPVQLLTQRDSEAARWQGVMYLEKMQTLHTLYQEMLSERQTQQQNDEQRGSCEGAVIETGHQHASEGLTSQPSILEVMKGSAACWHSPEVSPLSGGVLRTAFLETLDCSSTPTTAGDANGGVLSHWWGTAHGAHRTGHHNGATIFGTLRPAERKALRKSLHASIGVASSEALLDVSSYLGCTRTSIQ